VKQRNEQEKKERKNKKEQESICVAGVGFFFFHQSRLPPFFSSSSASHLSQPILESLFRKDQSIQVSFFPSTRSNTFIIKNSILIIFNLFFFLHLIHDHE